MTHPSLIVFIVSHATASSVLALELLSLSHQVVFNTDENGLAWLLVDVDCGTWEGGSVGVGGRLGVGIIVLRECQSHR